MICRQTRSPAGDRLQRDRIPRKNHGCVQASASILVQSFQKTVTARNQSSAAVLGFEAEIGQIAEGHGLSVDESRCNRARAETGDPSSFAIASNSHLKEISANTAGREEIRFAFERHTDRAGNGVTAQQRPKFLVIGRGRQFNIES